jgi:hypothetical protein
MIGNSGRPARVSVTPDPPQIIVGRSANEHCGYREEHSEQFP